MPSSAPAVCPAITVLKLAVPAGTKLAMTRQAGVGRALAVTRR
jgi:hypothetical protein